MKQTGIWIDKRAAKIVLIENGKESLSTIKSGIEEFNPKGGSGTRSKGGPQDVVQDSKYLNREKHQFAIFFENIIAKIEDADAIVIFGPAEAGQKLHTELLQKHPHLHAKTSPVEKADIMTDNQLKAWVRDFYTSKNS
jgi:hypothetical protein